MCVRLERTHRETEGGGPSSMSSANSSFFPSPCPSHPRENSRVAAAQQPQNSTHQSLPHSLRPAEKELCVRLILVLLDGEEDEKEGGWHSIVGRRCLARRTPYKYGQRERQREGSQTNGE